MQQRQNVDIVSTSREEHRKVMSSTTLERKENVTNLSLKQHRELKKASLEQQQSLVTSTIERKANAAVSSLEQYHEVAKTMLEQQQNITSTMPDDFRDIKRPIGSKIQQKVCSERKAKTGFSNEDFASQLEEFQRLNKHIDSISGGEVDSNNNEQPEKDREQKPKKGGFKKPKLFIVGTKQNLNISTSSAVKPGSKPSKLSSMKYPIMRLSKSPSPRSGSPTQKR